MAYIYILESLKNKSYYIGSTNNLSRRLDQHNSGNVKSTKYKKPYKIAFYQEFANLDIAKKVESKIKRWKRKDFIKKIIDNGEITIVGG